MEGQIQATGMQIARFAAVSGADCAEKIPGLSDGQLGCLLSHLELMERHRSGDEDLLILEDDEELSSLFPMVRTLGDHLRRTGAGWDIAYLDATLVQPSLILNLAKSRANAPGGAVQPVKLGLGCQAFGTHAYLLNRESVATVADLVKRCMRSGKALDNILVALAENGLTRNHITVPFLACGSADALSSQIGAADDGRVEIWLEIRRIMASTSFTESDRNRLGRLVQRHRSLFGDERFAHSVRIGG